jgi:hypothetical protein
MESIANFFLKTNIHLMVLVLVTIAISIYFVIMKALNKESKITFFPFIFPIVVTFLIAYATQEYARNKSTLNDVDFFCSQIERFAPNEYSKEKLFEIHDELTGIKIGKLEMFLAGESFKELHRAISKVNYEAQFIDHYILSWENELDLIYQANLAAIGRGVKIARLFILTDVTVKDPKRLEIAYKIMEKQNRDGINIKYARQYDLIRSDIKYPSYALNNLAFFDQKVLFIFTPTTQDYGIPTHTLILWNKNDILEKNPWPGLSISKYVFEFNSDSKRNIFSREFINY